MYLYLSVINLLVSVLFSFVGDTPRLCVTTIRPSGNFTRITHSETATAAKGRRHCGQGPPPLRPTSLLPPEPPPRQQSSLAMDRYCDRPIWQGPHRIPPPEQGIHFSLRAAEGSISHTSSSDHKNHTTRSRRVWGKKRLAKLIHSRRVPSVPSLRKIL